MSLTTDMDTTPTVTTTARGLLMLRLDASTQGYVPYYGYGHYAYGHYYGKRSADADADAEAFYGTYGYPYGLGYNLGYAGYGYAGYPYATYGHGIAATNAALGHAVAYTAGGVTHSSNVGVCTNYLGAVVPC